jgi:hypothetical protein
MDGSPDASQPTHHVPALPSSGRPDPFVPVLLAWLVPGAGHLKIGRLWPGVFVFAAILPLYAGGMALAGFENVSWVRHPIYFWAVQIFCGLPTAVAAYLTQSVANTRPMPDQSTGELFTAVACLLNVIAISDVWSRCSRGDPEARAAARAQAAAAAAAAAPEAAGEVSGG